MKNRELAGDRTRTHTSTVKTQRPATVPPAAELPSSTTSSGATRSSTPSLIGSRSGARLKCFNCGMDGHVARSCPYPRKSRREEEGRGSRRTDPPHTTMSALVGGGGDSHSEMEQLRRRLQEVEKKLAQETRTQVLKTVSAEPGGGTGRLGPCDVAEVSVNGVPTKALVDTGSPATIVALEFVIDIFVRERRDHQTPAQWRAETLTKFSPLYVLLKAYSGHKLNILSQVCLQLKHGSRTVKATVLVQEGAPTKLLLGTDLQSQLGFSLLAETGTTLTDLLTGEVCSQEPESSDAPEKRMRHGEPDDSGTTHDLKKVGGAKQYRDDSNTGLRRGVPDHPPSQTIRSLPRMFAHLSRAKRHREVFP